MSAMLLTVLVMFVGSAVFAALPHAPAPARGGYARAWNLVSVLAVPALINFLLLLVWDSVRLCDQMVRHLSSARSVYPAASLSVALRRGGFRSLTASSWLDVSIIAAHTETLCKGVFYPLVVLFIFILARYNRFDNWTINAPLLIVLSLSTGITVLSAWSFDRSAAFAREEELGRLNRLRDRLSRRSAHAPPGAGAAAALVDKAIKTIESCREGAFNPIRNHPLVSAIILPAGSLIGLAVLEMLMGHI